MSQYESRFRNVGEMMVRTRNVVWNRTSCNAMSQASAFLGGIFFTSILMLLQQKENFTTVVLELPLLDLTEIIVTQLHILSIPLTLSVVMFVFSAIRFAGACSYEDVTRIDYNARFAYATFKIGFVSMLVSLAAILLVVDITVGLLGILFIIGTSIYFASK